MSSFESKTCPSGASESACVVPTSFTNPEPSEVDQVCQASVQTRTSSTSNGFRQELAEKLKELEVDRLAAQKNIETTKANLEEAQSGFLNSPLTLLSGHQKALTEQLGTEQLHAKLLEAKARGYNNTLKLLDEVEKSSSPELIAQLEKQLEKFPLNNQEIYRNYIAALQSSNQTLAAVDETYRRQEVVVRTTRNVAIATGAAIATGGVLGGTYLAGATAGMGTVGTTATALATGTALGTTAGAIGNAVEATGHVALGNKTTGQAVGDALQQTSSDLRTAASGALNAAGGMAAAKGVGMVAGVVGSTTTNAVVQAAANNTSVIKVISGAAAGSAGALTSGVANTGLDVATGARPLDIAAISKDLVFDAGVGFLAGGLGGGASVIKEGKSALTFGATTAAEVSGDLAIGYGSAALRAKLEGRELTFDEVTQEVAGSILGTTIGEMGAQHGVAAAEAMRNNYDPATRNLAALTLPVARTSNEHGAVAPKLELDGKQIQQLIPNNEIHPRTGFIREVNAYLTELQNAKAISTPEQAREAVHVWKLENAERYNLDLPTEFTESYSQQRQAYNDTLNTYREKISELRQQELSLRLTPERHAAYQTLYRQSAYAVHLERAKDIATRVKQTDERNQAYREIITAQVKAGDMQAVKETISAIEGEPDRNSSYRKLATAQAISGDIDAANETVAALDTHTRAYAFCDIAAAQAQAGDIDAAKKTAATIENKTNRSYAYSKIASAQLRAGDIQAAKLTLTASEDNADTLMSYRDIAAAQAQAGDIEGAGETLKLLGGGARSHDVIRREISAAHARAGDIEAAKVSASKIQDKNERVDAHLKIATIQAQAGDIQAAKQAVAAIAEKETHPDAHIEIAAAQAKAGDIDAAKETAAACVFDKDRAHALREIAIAQAQAGDTQAAKETLTTIKYYQDRVDTYRGIYTSQVQAGDIQGAKETAAEIEYASPRATAYLEIATAQADIGNISQALTTLSQELKLLKDHYRLPLTAAKIYSEATKESRSTLAQYEQQQLLQDFGNNEAYYFHGFNNPQIASNEQFSTALPRDKQISLLLGAAEGIQKANPELSKVYVIEATNLAGKSSQFADRAALANGLRFAEYETASNLLLNQLAQGAADPATQLRYLKTLIEIENPKGKALATKLYADPNLVPQHKEYLARKLISVGYWDKNLGAHLTQALSKHGRVETDAILTGLITELGLTPDLGSFKALEATGLLQSESVASRLAELKQHKQRFIGMPRETLLDTFAKDPAALQIYYLLHGGEYQYSLINDYSFEKFKLIVEKINGLRISEEKLQTMVESLTAASKSETEISAILDNLKRGTPAITSGDRVVKFMANAEFGSQREAGLNRLNSDVWADELKSLIALGAMNSSAANISEAKTFFEKNRASLEQHANAQGLFKTLQIVEKQDERTLDELATKLRKELINTARQRGEGAELQTLQHVDTQEVIARYLLSKFPGLEKTGAFSEWQSHLSEVMTQLTTSAKGKNKESRNIEFELTFLDKGEDFIRSVRFADGQQCCFNSSKYIIQGDIGSADWIARLNKDPLSFMVDIKQADTNTISGFVFGRMATNPQTGKPVVMLNGIYSQFKGETINNNILQIIEERFARNLGADGIAIAAIHGGALSKAPNGYETVKGLNLNAIRAIDETNTYDDIGTVANGPFEFSGYFKKLDYQNIDVRNEDHYHAQSADESQSIEEGVNAILNRLEAAESAFRDHAGGSETSPEAQTRVEYMEQLLSADFEEAAALLSPAKLVEMAKISNEDLATIAEPVIVNFLEFMAYTLKHNAIAPELNGTELQTFLATLSTRLTPEPAITKWSIARQREFHLAVSNDKTIQTIRHVYADHLRSLRDFERNQKTQECQEILKALEPLAHAYATRISELFAQSHGFEAPKVNFYSFGSEPEGRSWLGYADTHGLGEIHIRSDGRININQLQNTTIHELQHILQNWIIEKYCDSSKQQLSSTDQQSISAFSPRGLPEKFLPAMKAFAHKLQLAETFYTQPQANRELYNQNLKELDANFPRNHLINVRKNATDDIISVLHLAVDGVDRILTAFRGEAVFDGDVLSPITPIEFSTLYSDAAIKRRFDLLPQSAKDTLIQQLDKNQLSVETLQETFAKFDKFALRAVAESPGFNEWLRWLSPNERTQLAHQVVNGVHYEELLQSWNLHWLPSHERYYSQLAESAAKQEESLRTILRSMPDQSTSQVAHADADKILNDQRSKTSSGFSAAAGERPVATPVELEAVKDISGFNAHMLKSGKAVLSIVSKDEVRVNNIAVLGSETSGATYKRTADGRVHEIIFNAEQQLDKGFHSVSFDLLVEQLRENAALGESQNKTVNDITPETITVGDFVNRPIAELQESVSNHQATLREKLNSNYKQFIGIGLSGQKAEQLQYILENHQTHRLSNGQLNVVTIPNVEGAHQSEMLFDGLVAMLSTVQRYATDPTASYNQREIEQPGGVLVFNNANYNSNEIYGHSSRPSSYDARMSSRSFQDVSPDIWNDHFVGVIPHEQLFPELEGLATLKLPEQKQNATLEEIQRFDEMLQRRDLLRQHATQIAIERLMNLLEQEKEKIHAQLIEPINEIIESDTLMLESGSAIFTIVNNDEVRVNYAGTLDSESVSVYKRRTNGETTEIRLRGEKQVHKERHSVSFDLLVEQLRESAALGKEKRLGESSIDE